MEALTIFWNLAKVLGIIFLIILAIILLILALILFCNIKINMVANNIDNNYYKIKVTYLLGAISYSLDSKTNKNIIKILGIDISKLKKKDKKAKKEKNIKQKDFNKKTNNKKDDIKQEPFLDKDIQTNLVSKEELKEEKINQDINKNLQIEDNIQRKLKKQKKEKSKDKNGKNLKQKIDEIKQKIEYFINYPDKDYIIKSVISLIKNVLKAIKFKKIFINIEYGLDEPFKTGNVCAIISSIMPFMKNKYTKDIKLMPNFEQTIFLADVDIKCRFKIFNILWPILVFITKKPIRNIIFRKGE